MAAALSAYEGESTPPFDVDFFRRYSFGALSRICLERGGT